MERNDLLLAFDIGTTSVKGALYTASGSCLLHHSIGYHKFSAQPGWSEQHPDDWMNCISAILERIGRQADLSAVVAIGICSQVNTHVFVDSEGRSLMPAIVWDDQRCSAAAADLNRRIERERLDGVPGQDSSALTARAEWVKRQQPDIWARTRHILSPKDYCILQITGAAVTDQLSSIGLVDEAGNYLPQVLNLVEGLQQRLPPVQPFCQVAGRVRPDFIAALAGCPVVVATMDAWASLFGSGAFRHGGGYQVAGTSEIIGLVSREQIAADGIVTFPRYQDLYLHAGPTQAGGDALRWFAAAQGKSIADLLAAVEADQTGAEPLLFLPYLLGERAPIWDPQARGAFIGLTKNHNASNMTRAVMEGVGFSARHLLEHLEQAAGFSSDGLIISGGAASSDLWCQIKANIMNRTLHRAANIDTGAFGAALMAAVGAGLYPDLNAAMAQGVSVQRSFEPQTGQCARYDDLYPLYRDSYQQLRPVFERLADL